MYAEVFAYSAWFSVLHRVYLVYTLYGTLECGARHIESTLLSSGADAQRKRDTPRRRYTTRGYLSWKLQILYIVHVYGRYLF